MQAVPLPDKRKSSLLLIFGCLGILVLLGRGIYLVVTGLSSFSLILNTPNEQMANDLLDATGMFFCALLLLPLIYYNVRQLKSHAFGPGEIPPVKAWQVILLVVIWLVIVLVGSLLGGVKFGWIALIPIFPLGLALPVVLLAWIACGGIPTGSRRRLWSVFGIGLIGSTGLALLIEYLALGMAAVVFGIFALGHPEWLTLLKDLKSQITNATDMQSLVTVLAPYLTNPFVFIILLAGAAGVGPLIEEAAKPLPIWLLGDRLHSPGEGFVLGALCGAGFALLEGLMAASGASQLWGVGMAARVASSLMHITASAIAGWGIASFRLKRSYGRLAVAFLTSTGLHGLWNGSTLLVAFGSLRFSVQNNRPDVISALIVVVGGMGLLVLFALILVALPVVNRKLRPPTASLQPSPGPQIDV
jgi:RsiW-degrading membrane proteinase PrsW (M82 family)